MNPPMNHNNFLIAMLDAYVAWLNIWLDAERVPDGAYDPPRYTVQGFAQDPQTRVRALVPTGSSNTYERLLVEATVYDGDDGGPTDLTAWFDIDTHEGTNPLVAMVQGFDTNLQFIMRNRSFTNLP